jgi:hypothetical protein
MTLTTHRLHLASYQYATEEEREKKFPIVKSNRRSKKLDLSPLGRLNKKSASSILVKKKKQWTLLRI